MSLCAVGQLAEYLGLDILPGAPGEADIALLQRLAEAASEMIERYTGRTFAVGADSTRAFNPTTDCRGAWLFFNADLAAAPTSVTNGDGAVLAATDYVLQPRHAAPFYALKLLPSSGVSWTFVGDADDAIAVVGKWGYSTAPPADVVHACIRLAAFFYRQRDNAQDSDRTIVTAVGALSPVSLPQDVTTILRPYIRGTQ